MRGGGPSSALLHPNTLMQVGLGIGEQNGKFVVAHVLPGLSADLSGRVQIGDEIIRVRGRKEF